MGASVFAIITAMIVLNLNGVYLLEIKLTMEPGGAYYLGIIGTSVEFSCSFKLAEGEMATHIHYVAEKYGKRKNVVRKNIATSQVLKEDGWEHARYFYHRTRQGDPSLSFDIDGIECKDSRTYICEVIYTKDGEKQPRGFASKQLFVTMEKPQLSAWGLEAGGKSVFAGRDVSFVCSALSGKNGTGALVWSIFRHDHTTVEGITHTDLRVIEDTRHVSNNDCSERIISNLTFTTQPDDHDLEIACFNGHVTHAPMKPMQPLICNPAENDLCARVGPMYVIAPVSMNEIDISVVPTEILEDDTVTLTCHVAAYPEPTLTWARNGHVLHSVKTSYGERKLKLTNVQKDSDSGVYDCIAFNVVKTLNYSATVGKNVSIAGNDILDKLLSRLEDLAKKLGIDVFTLIGAIAFVFVATIIVLPTLFTVCVLMCTCYCCRKRKKKMPGNSEKK